MADATQKLVDEARKRALALYGEASDANAEHPQDTDQWGDAERLDALADALEAAQRSLVPEDPQEFENEIQIERSRQRTKGYDAAHDREHGEKHRVWDAVC